MSGIGGDDDIESITRETAKRQQAEQALLPAEVVDPNATPLSIVAKKPRLDDVQAQGMMDACRAASMAATAATEAVQMMQRFMESRMMHVVQHAVSQVGGGDGPAGSGDSISCTLPHDEISVLSDEVVRHLSAVGTHFEKNVKKFVRASGQLEGAISDVKYMEDGAPGERRYPSGCKPWGTPAEYSELDGVWSAAAGGDCNFTVSIPSDTSRRDAMAMVHHQFTLMHKKIFLEALQEHIASLKPLVTKQAFFDKAGDISFDVPPSLGLEDAVRKVPDTKLIYSKAEALYTKLVERARNKKQLEMKQKFDQVAKKRKDETLLESAQPDRVLGELIDLAIDRRVKRGSDIQMDPIETPSSPASDEEAKALAEKASVFVAAVAHAQGRHRREGQKNLVSPGGGPGASTGKGPLGKWTAAGSKGGKGKGKGKPSNKGKGKGKGGSAGVASAVTPPKASQSPPSQWNAAQNSPTKRQWGNTPGWWNKSPVADRAQGKGNKGGSGGKGNNRKGRSW